MNRYCEKALFQRSETARGAKPHGGCAQGSPQSTGSGGASAAGFASWQRREMAHHQFQAGRPCLVQTGIAWAFPSSNSRKSSEHATRQDSLTFSSEDFRELLEGKAHARSEEHTSELQSRENLVC